MSYILDAIRESERARGNRKTCDLFEAPVEDTVIPQLENPRRPLRWQCIVAFSLLLNVGFVVFWLHSRQGTQNADVAGSRISGRQSLETGQEHASVIPRDAARPPQVDQAATESLKTKPAGAGLAPSPLPATTSGVPPKDPIAVNEPVDPKSPQSTYAAEGQQGLKTPNLENQQAHSQKPVQPAAGNAPISAGQSSAETGASLARPADLHEVKWQDLPPRILYALPDLSVSMLIYSKNPGDRWININGSKKREGEEISAGLRLEEITPKGSIFSYQGYRFYKAVIGD